MTADFSILNPSQRAQLTAIQQTQSLTDRTQLRLASGLAVNSAIDNPQNFFASRELDYRASDLERLLDSIGQNLQVLEATDNALQAIGFILDQSEALMNELKLDLTTNQQSLKEVILADSPDAYWRLNETSGNVALNLGSAGTAINGTYNANIQKGDDQLYIGGDSDVAAHFTGGNNHRVSIPDSNLINLQPASERTVELVFNADSTINRQVLYEEGGATNSLTMYIENGQVHITGRDQGAWGPSNIVADIEPGETYHLAFVFDFPHRTFTGYLNGEEIGQVSVNAVFPAHSADIGIGGMNNDAWFHDGAVNGDGFEFTGRIADVALYNKALSADDMQARYKATFLDKSAQAEERLNTLMAQLDLVVQDATYKGINLLDGDDMVTVFNEHRTSTLVTYGGHFNSAGLGIDDNPQFYKEQDIEDRFDQLRSAVEKVRAYNSSLANDFAVLETRRQFMVSMSNTLHEGADKLTLLDQNAEGAKMLALQTRQQIQISVLASSGQAANIADLLV